VVGADSADLTRMRLGMLVARIHSVVIQGKQSAGIIQAGGSVRQFPRKERAYETMIEPETIESPTP